MRTGRSRSWAAWATSALLHALVAALLLRAGQRTTPPAPETAETVEVEVDLRADVDKRQAGRGDKRQAAPTSPTNDTAVPRSPANETAATAAPAGEEAARGDAGDKDAPPIDLSFGGLADDVKGHIAGPPPPAGLRRARPGRFSVDELRADQEREQDAIANVQRGRADPLLYDYLRGARARFQEQAERLADAIPVGPGDMARAWGRGYLRSVEAANRGELGARVDAPRQGGGDTRNEISPNADVLGAYAEARRQSETGAEERRAEVCLDVAAGREPAVVLRHTSGNDALDRLTVDSFTKAVAARPVPPDTRRGLACYELRISAYRTPPLPVLGCGFDIGFSGLGCVLPFQKVTAVKGRLLSVEYPPAD